MGLFAALIPPDSAREELARAVRSVGGDTPELAAVPAASIHLPITSFGNVSGRDAAALAGLLRSEAAAWARPVLCFSGGTALEWPGDESVWAKLEGEVEQLTDIGRGVPGAVKRLGFFVDRRQFRPWMSVGTITSSTTAPYLQALVDALEAFCGESWTLPELCLVRRLPATPDQQGEGFEVVDRFPLGAGDAATASRPAPRVPGSSG